MANKKELYLIIRDNEIIIREWATLRDISKTLDAFRVMYPGHIIILAREVIAEDEL